MAAEPFSPCSLPVVHLLQSDGNLLTHRVGFSVLRHAMPSTAISCPPYAFSFFRPFCRLLQSHSRPTRLLRPWHRGRTDGLESYSKENGSARSLPVLPCWHSSLSSSSCYWSSTPSTWAMQVCLASESNNNDMDQMGLLPRRDSCYYLGGTRTTVKEAVPRAICRLLQNTFDSQGNSLTTPTVPEAATPTSSTNVSCYRHRHYRFSNGRMRLEVTHIK
jgi:hypothetical protein